MQSILDTLWGLILGLLGVVVAGVAIIEVMARTVLASFGIQETHRRCCCSCFWEH